MRNETALTARQISEVLSTRATKVLTELGVQTVQQLGDLNPSLIRPILGAGPKTIREIVVFQERLFGQYQHPVMDEIAGVNPDARLLDGFEEGLIGYVEAGRADEDECELPAYDSEKCIGIIIDRGNTREEAENHLAKILRKLGSLGQNAPVFIVRKDNPTGDEIAEFNPDARLADGLEAGLIGYTDPRQGTKTVAVYDSEKCVDAIMLDQASRHDEDDDEESEEERLESAESHLSYNYYGDLINYGEDSPVFVRLVDNPFAIHN
jgi:hypothetical protein